MVFIVSFVRTTKGKSKRKLSYETLEKRYLAAVDLAIGTDADNLSASKLAFTSSLGAAFPWLGPTSLEVGKSFLSVESQGLRVFIQSGNGYAETDSYSVRSPVERSAIVSVESIGDRVLVVATSSNDAQTVVTTTLSLLKITDTGKIDLIDRVERSSDFRTVQVVDDLFVVSYLVDDNLVGSSKESKDAEHQMTSTYLSYQGERLYDVIDSGAVRLPARATVGSNGVLRVFSTGNGMALVSASLDRNFLLVDLHDGQSQTLLTPLPDELAKLTRVEVTDAGLKLFGQSSLAQDNYVSVTMSPGGDVLATETIRTGAAGHLQIDSESFINGVFQQRDTGVAVLPGGPSGRDLRIVDSTDAGYSEQIVSLPGYSVGYRPAFVVDKDTLLAVRANVAPILADPNVDLNTVKPELHVTLLHRNSDGVFAPVSDLSIGNFDFRSAGRVSADGTVTLQNENESLILRVREKSIETQLIPVVRAKNSPYDSKISGFSHATFVSTDTTTQILSPDSKNIDSFFGQIGLANDANGDGTVNPLDALVVINYLNLLETSNNFIPALDTDHDGSITPLDALTVINALNNRAGEAEGVAFERTAPKFPIVYDSIDLEVKRRRS